MLARTSAWGVGVLLASTMLIAACGAAPEETTASPAATARGVYALQDPTGDLLVLSLFDKEHYWSWKNTDECRDLSVLRASCEEQGRYVIEEGTLTLSPDGGVAHGYPFEAGPADDPPTTAITPRDLVGGTSGAPLVTAGSGVGQPVAGTLSVGGRAMALVERGVKLLTTCEERSHGSGAIPGAPSPGANFANGSFSSGDFAPGGRYDPRAAAGGTPTLYESASTGDHHYALLSDRLPAGTTFNEANAALQRFNGPTGPALSGQGDDPNSTAGWVVDPLTGEIPVGCVTFERGNGWARNTTQAVHPFVGTITRYVVDAGNCTYRILTTGDGVTPSTTETGISGFLVRSGQELISGARNLGNTVGGPLIFRQLDRRLLESVHPAGAAGGC